MGRRRSSPIVAFCVAQGIAAGLSQNSPAIESTKANFSVRTANEDSLTAKSAYYCSHDVCEPRSPLKLFPILN